jgi:hypothetical protein
MNWYKCLELISKKGYPTKEIIEILVDTLNSKQAPELKIEIARELGNIDSTNSVAFSSLHKIMADRSNPRLRIEAAEALYRFQPHDSHLPEVLDDLMIKIGCEWPYALPSWFQAALLALKIEPNHERALTLLTNSIFADDSTTAEIAVSHILEMRNSNQLLFIVENICDILSSPFDVLVNEENPEFYVSFYYELINRVLFHCAQYVTYPDFYFAWNSVENKNELIQFPNLIGLPTYFSRSDLTSCDRLNLFMIDSQQFSSPENPTEDIYIEMLDQGCPEATNRRPTTLTQLKTYWRLDLKSLDKTPALIIYNSQNSSQLFSETFLQTLSTFGGLICVITDQTQPNLQTFSPNQPELAQSIAKWLERSILEA